MALNTTTQILTAQQRRIISFFHFIFAINWIMINVAHVKRGLQWISFSSLAELVFADDIYLTFHCHLHMHGKTYYEEHKAEKLGLKITQKRIVQCIFTAGNQHKQNSWFCKEIREDNFRFWWRRVHEDTSQGMYMSYIEIFFFTARILHNQRMLCCGECFHD